MYFYSNSCTDAKAYLLYTVTINHIMGLPVPVEGGDMVTDGHLCVPASLHYTDPASIDTLLQPPR